MKKSFFHSLLFLAFLSAFAILGCATSSDSSDADDTDTNNPNGNNPDDDGNDDPNNPNNPGDTDGCSHEFSLDDECSQCLEDECCDKYDACDANVSCNAYYDCLMDCSPDDELCNAMCKGTHSEGQPGIDAIIECKSTKCKVPCNAGTCSISINDPCMNTNCCPQIEACFSNTNCTGLMDCLRNCTDQTCADVCSQQNPDGVPAYEDLTDCSAEHC